MTDIGGMSDAEYKAFKRKEAQIDKMIDEKANTNGNNYGNVDYDSGYYSRIASPFQDDREKIVNHILDDYAHGGDKVRSELAHLHDVRAEIEDREDALKKDRAALKKLQKSVTAREAKLKLSPTARLQKALDLEEKLAEEQITLGASKQGLKTKEQQFERLKKKKLKAMDKAAKDQKIAIAEIEIKLVQTSDIELEKAKKGAKAEAKKEYNSKRAGLEKKSEEIRVKIQSAKFEAGRLSKMRHDLSDREAAVAAKEDAVRQIEQTKMATNHITHKDDNHRPLEV